MSRGIRKQGAGKRRGVTVRDLIAQASAHSQAGRPADAEALCRRILEAKPDQPHAMYLLGVAIHQARRDPTAIRFVEKAIELKPDFAEAHNGLGLLLHDHGRLDAALIAHQRALHVRPEMVEAHRAIGACRLARGEIDAGLIDYARARELAPDSVGLLAECTAVLRGLGRGEEALAVAQEAAGRLDDSSEAQSLLAMELHHEGHLADAASAHRRAIELAPDAAVAHTNLGVTLQALGDLDGAAACHDRASRIDPRNARAQHNRALVLMEQNRLDDAEEAFTKALIADPKDPDLHWDHSLALLRAGRLREGWDEFEWRWLAPGFGSRERHRDRPRWDGSALDGRRLLVHAEQGLGDTIQFARYLTILARPGARVVFECPPPLSRLMRSLNGPEDILHRDQSPESVDVQIPLLSLPRVFGTTTRSIPATIPYLKPADEDRARYAEQIGDAGAIRVGFAWGGSETHRNDAQRSLPAKLLEPVVALPNVAGFSLQVGRNSAESPPGLVDLGARFSDFADTAAAMANLDLVVTVDTAVAHLAGAIGVPVWVLLPFAPDWRWLQDREDSPWYPTMRLFRQKARGAWAPVLARLAQALAASDRASLVSGNPYGTLTPPPDRST